MFVYTKLSRKSDWTYMIETLLITLLVAKIKKYRLTPLFKEWPTYLLLIFALLYLYMNYSIFQGNSFFTKYVTAYKVAVVFIFAIMIMKYNLYKAGFISVALIALGGLLNNIVIKANGDRMPVFPSFSYTTGYIKPDTFKNLNDGLHVLGSPATRLAFLGDHIDLGYSIFSIGDVFIFSFVFLITLGVIKQLNKSCPVNAEENKIKSSPL